MTCENFTNKSVHQWNHYFTNSSEQNMALAGITCTRQERVWPYLGVRIISCRLEVFRERCAWFFWPRDEKEMKTRNKFHSHSEKIWLALLMQETQFHLKFGNQPLQPHNQKSRSTTKHPHPPPSHRLQAIHMNTPNTNTTSPRQQRHLTLALDSCPFSAAGDLPPLLKWQTAGAPHLRDEKWQINKHFRTWKRERKQLSIKPTNFTSRQVLKSHPKRG